MELERTKMTCSKMKLLSMMSFKIKRCNDTGVLKLLCSVLHGTLFADLLVLVLFNVCFSQSPWSTIKTRIRVSSSRVVHVFA